MMMIKMEIANIITSIYNKGNINKNTRIFFNDDNNNINRMLII